MGVVYFKGNKMKEKTIYYRDELNDEFSGIKRETVTVDDKYKYTKRCFLWKCCRFVVYRMVMTPFAWLYMKIKFHHKIIGKKALKESKGNGVFMYGNHSLMAGDAFIPNLVSLPRNVYMIVHADNISTPITRPFIEMSGALPLPTVSSGMRNFMGAIDDVLGKKAVVQIYPEAHIWPYYTEIRPFVSTSFKYPIKYNAPVYAITNTYHKKKIGRVPKVITYVDGPFYPDKTLSVKEQQEDLRNRVYSMMCSRAKLSTYRYIKYIKEETNND